jgi:DNA-binding transcriptional regulator/RsmH inhibitor MraZ
MEKGGGQMSKTRGNAEGTLDQKSRAAVPARFASMFPEGEELVLWEPQGSAQPYLVLTVDSYFEEVLDREYALAGRAERQDLLRDALGHMETVELDAARRFVVPEKYHGKAGFEKGGKLFFLANRSYMEIWPMAVWRAWESARRKDLCRFDYTPDPVRVPAENDDDISA